jgi:hypothetical protein
MFNATASLGFGVYALPLLFLVIGVWWGTRRKRQ